ncbi:MAG: CopD family protein [Burkholderiaceae bacterium]
MLYATLKSLHLLSIIIWVGGMAFTLFFLRPALAELELPLRVQLMHEILRKFFKAVLVMALIALLSGVGMMLLYSSRALQAGDGARMPWTWSVMAGLGVLMILIFGHIRFVLFKRLGQSLANHAWTTGGAAMASIRVWVRINLMLGLLIVVLVITGR